MEFQREIKVFPDKLNLSSYAADKIGEIALEAVNNRGSYHMVLSGGGTPTLLVHILPANLQRIYNESIPVS